MTGIFGPAGTQPPEPTTAADLCTNCGDPCTIPPLCAPCRYPRTGRDAEGHAGSAVGLGEKMPRGKPRGRHAPPNDAIRLSREDQQRTAAKVAEMDPFYARRRAESKARRK